MTRIAAVLAAVLLSGCVSSGAPTVSGPSPPLSADAWEVARLAARHAPPSLREAIDTEGVARFSTTEGTGPTGAQSSARGALADVLANARGKALLPDAEFDKLADAVTGANADPRGAYATALADYLTQDGFACRQPLYARYFKRRYADGRDIRCNLPVPFSVLSRFEGPRTEWVDPKRVRAIHLLFAGKGESIASRFGHVSLRLIVCPSDNATDDECDTSLDLHLTLGFMAHIDEFSLDSFKALNGKYRAYLFASHFMDVYEEYAIGEFRELYSLPLRLDGERREAMVRELAEIHWRHAGEYRFISRNCATLLQEALRATWPEFAAEKGRSAPFARPNRFFDDVRSGALTEGDKLAPPNTAERDGFYFPDTKRFYDRAAQAVRREMESPPFSDLESYLNIDPRKRRLAFTGNGRYPALLAADSHLREAQLMLEELDFLRYGRLMMAEGAKYFEEQDFLAKSEAVRAGLDEKHAKVFEECLLAPVRQQTSPIQRLGGVPDQDDLPPFAGGEGACRSAENRQLLHEVIDGIKDGRSEQWRRFAAISRYWYEIVGNIDILKRM